MQGREKANSVVPSEDPIYASAKSSVIEIFTVHRLSYRCSIFYIYYLHRNDTKWALTFCEFYANKDIRSEREYWERLQLIAKSV